MYWMLFKSPLANWRLFSSYIDPVNSPTSSLFSDFGALSISQRRKVSRQASHQDEKSSSFWMGHLKHKCGAFHQLCFFFFLSFALSASIGSGVSLSLLSFCATRLQTRQQVNSSLRELRVWPRWLSLQSRPSPPRSFHIPALAAPQLLHWHQVSVNTALQNKEITLHVCFFSLCFYLPMYLLLNKQKTPFSFGWRTFCKITASQHLKTILIILILLIILIPFLFLSGMSLSAGSSPLHSPKITPHTSPAPRRRSHTPNPANYMVPTTASDQGAHIIQKETVGGTTYFYTDNTPAPMAGMVCAADGVFLCVVVVFLSPRVLRKALINKMY